MRKPTLEPEHSAVFMPKPEEYTSPGRVAVQHEPFIAPSTEETADEPAVASDAGTDDDS